MRGPSFSGAHLEFGACIVSKTAAGVTGVRLVEQFGLMRGFRTKVKGVRVPNVGILSTAESNDEPVQLFVERVHGPGLFLACEHWEAHMEKVIELIEEEFLQCSSPKRVGPGMIDKLASIDRILNDADRVELIDPCLDLLVDVMSEQGPCHGDLTLCNVLCDCHKSGPGAIALVDMIDPFIRSPHQDVAKVRQDTHHGWIKLHLPAVDDARLERCGQMLDEAFPQTRTSLAFELLTLLRILPYTTDDRVFSWVRKEIARCLTQEGTPSS